MTRSNKLTIMAAGVITCLLSSLCVTFSSCNGCSGESTDSLSADTIVADSDTLVVDVPTLTEMTGVVEEATKSALFIVTDDGQEVEMELANGPVVGSVEEGDRIQVVYNEKDGEYQAVIAVNLTSLQHLWVEHSNNTVSRLELDAYGKAITYGTFNSHNYDGWEVSDGMLLLHSSESAVREQTPTDTFLISQLSNDSLILFNNRSEFKFKREN